MSISRVLQKLPAYSSSLSRRTIQPSRLSRPDHRMAYNSSNAAMTAVANALPKETLKTLRNYTACDISDALLRLKVPGAGFLPDLISYSTSEGGGVCPSGPVSRGGYIPVTLPIHVAPASTVYFISKSDTIENHPQGNIPEGQHWVDLTVPGTFVIEQQPEGQNNAVLGGIMARRMKKLHAAGIVVNGRIRDVREMREIGVTVGVSIPFLIMADFSDMGQSNLNSGHSS